MKKNDILAIIPARGGSKGIPKKNIYPLCGKPLISYSIDAAKGSNLISRVIVSTDSEEIIDIALKYGAEIPFKRPKELAKDCTPALSVIQHAVNWLCETENYRPDYIILLQPTSPLRTSKHIDESLEMLIRSDADSIVSVLKVPHQYVPESIMKLDDGYLKNYLPYDERKNLRQLKPIYYARNGAAIYAFAYKCLMEKNTFFGNKILPYIMNRNESIDIDEIFDIEICEMLIKSCD